MYLCGAEIDGISCEIRKSGLYLYLWMFFLTRRAHLASLAPEGRNDGWGGRARPNGLVGPNGPKASLYPRGA